MLDAFSFLTTQVKLFGDWFLPVNVSRETLNYINKRKGVKNNESKRFQTVA